IPGANSSTYLFNAVTQGDFYAVEMTSSLSCAKPTIVKSDSVTIMLAPTVTPSVSIAAYPGLKIKNGQTVNFVATSTHPGTNPLYQWRKNGKVANSYLYSNTWSTNDLADNDTITCIMTSNDPCATPTVVISNFLVIQNETSITEA